MFVDKRSACLANGVAWQALQDEEIPIPVLGWPPTRVNQIAPLSPRGETPNVTRREENVPV